MAAYVERTKLHNPAHRARKTKRKTLKAAWRHLKRRADGTFKKFTKNPKKKKSTRVRPVARKRPSKQRRAHRNPLPLLLTFGAPVVNPKGKSQMTKTRKKRRTATGQFKKTKHRRRSTKNATRVVILGSRRKSNPRRRTRRKVRVVNYRVRRRRSNPSLFGQTMSSSAIATAIAGGLLGVTATKVGVSYIPATIISSNFGKVIASIAVAFAAGFLAKKAVKAGPFGDAVLFGGLMQAGSVTLNAFVPSIGAKFGLGEFVQATYTVPENPFAQITAGPTLATVPATAAAGVSGYGGRPAFGGSRFFGR
jgi:hypothetical protein